MRFRDWDQYSTRFPAEADLLEREAESNEFLRDMKARILQGKDLTIRMRKALASWVGEGETSTKAVVPAKGDYVEARIEVYEAERAEGKFGVVNTYRFGSTADGWHGRLESNSAELEDLALEAGVTFDKERVEPPWRISVSAKVAWVADRKPFVILGGRYVKVLGERAPEKECPAPPEPPPALKVDPVPVKGGGIKVEYIDEQRSHPDCKGWQKSLGL